MLFAVLAGTVCVPAGGAATAADLTVGAFGGIWEQSLTRCTIEPFERATGATVEVVLGQPVQWLNQIAASPDNPPFDIVFLPSDNAFSFVERGLSDAFTAERVPNIEQLPDAFREIGQGFGVVHNYGAMGLIYNSETVTEPPETWHDFVDGVLEGRWYAAIPSINYAGSLSTMAWHYAHLYGGGVDDITPGLDKLSEMVDSGSVDFWSDPNAVLNGLITGEYDIAMYWDGRAWSFISDGNEQFVYINPEPGSVAAMTWIQKVSNGNDLAWDFINYALSAEAQGCFGSAIRYGVGNAEATFEPDVVDQITAFEELTFPPFEQINALASQWIEMWNRKIGR